MKEEKWLGRGKDLTDRQVKNFENGKARSMAYVTGESSLGYLYAPSPNFRQANRGKDDIFGVVLHSTEGWNGGVPTLVDPSRRASTHYGVERDGTIIQMVEEKDIAWHGGSTANNWTIGIEVAGFTKRPQEFSNGGKIKIGSSYADDIGFSKQQIDSLAELVAGITERYDIPLDKFHIFGHAHTGGCDGTSDAIPGAPKLDEEAGGGSCHYDMGSTFEFDEFIKLVKQKRFGSSKLPSFLLIGLGIASVYFMG